MLYGRRMKLPVHIRSRADAVQAYCPDLPGCSASAPTESEALRLLRERISDYFTAGASAPLPGARVVELEV